MSMPDQPGATVFQPVGRVAFKQDRQFGFDSLTDQLPRAVAYQIS